MVYERNLRKTGDILNLDATAYQITGVEGCGGSSVVYRAVYQDSLNRDQSHQVLIKELFPWHPKGAVYRDEDGCICCLDEGRELLEDSRRRYREGNQVNLELLKRYPSCVSGNLNSCEAYGTYYTVLSFHGGESLAERLKREGDALSLREAAELFGKILDALECFHKSKLLYLDISPENILLLPKQALLIDYNSVWRLDEAGNGGFSGFDGRAGYCAPEVRMQDQDQVGIPSDIYSLCAVFFRMITGRVLSEREVIGNRLREPFFQRIPVFEHEPKTAVYQAVRIFVKGLHLIPRLRYQSVEELRKDIDELIRRIDGRGVSHSALWESSRSLYKKQPASAASYLKQDISIGGEGTAAMDALLGHLRAGGKILLKGPGGMGKTRLLKELWRQGTERYHPKMPVIVYIPLRDYQEWQGENSYLLSFLLRHLRCGGEDGVIEDARHQLDKLLSVKTGLYASVIFLLDGLNETGSRRGKLLREIEELGKMAGTGILVTERSGEVLEYSLGDFAEAELLPLPLETIDFELERRGFPVPEGGQLRALLTNPMMLELYGQSCRMKGETGQACPEAALESPEKLVELYLHQMLLYQLRLDSGDEGLQLCHRYILKQVLPAIALRMEEKRSTILTFDEMFELVGKSWQKLHDESFGKCFREYLGKSRKMLEGLGNEAEWYDFVVEEQLRDRLSLLVKTESGCYGLIHDDFIPGLGKAGKANRETLEGNKRNRAKAGIMQKGAAAAFGAVLLCACLAGRVLLPKQSKGEREQFQMASERILVTANSLNGLYKAQEQIIEETGRWIDGQISGRDEDYREYIEKSLEGVTPSLRNDYGPYVSLLAGEDQAMSGALEDYFESPGEMTGQLACIGQWLCSWVTDEETDDERKELYLNEYKAYLKAYEYKTFYEFGLAAELLDEEGREYLLSAGSLRYADLFDAYYLESGQETTVPDELLRSLESHMVSGEASLEQVKKRLENRMEAMGGFTLTGGPRRRIVDDFASRIGEMEEASAVYDKALLAVGAYLRGELAREEVQGSLGEASETLKTIAEDARPHPVDGQLSGDLAAEGIDQEEYTVIADEYLGNLAAYRRDLERLQEILDQEENRENALPILSLEQETMWGIQEGLRGYYFCAVNYLFSGWDDEDAAYVREHILAGLHSLADPTLEWLEEKEKIETKASAFLDECEQWKDRRDRGLMELGEK